MRQMILARSVVKPKPRKTDKTPASAPTDITWSSPDPTSLVLSWKPGADPDSAIMRHEYRLDNGPITTADSPTGTTITGLTRRTTYTVQVRAVSAGGPSPWVSVDAQTIYAYTLPGLPAPLDDNHADIRPQTGISWTATVGPDATDDFASVADAVKAAYSADSNRTMSTRALILVKPGTYSAPLVDMHDWHAIIGTSGNPADVIIENVTSASIMNDSGGRGAIDTWGSTYVEGVTCKRVDTDAASGTLTNPKYAVHGTSGVCSIWVNCVFDTGASTNALGIPSVFGQDGGDGNYTLFYRSMFIGARHDSDTNVHAGAGNGTPGKPEQVVYVGCIWTTTNVLDTAPYPAPAGAFGFKPLNDNRQGDTLWIVDCEGIAFAQMFGGAGGIVHKPDSLPMASGSNPATIDNRTDWPKPIDWKVVTA